MLVILLLVPYSSLTGISRVGRWLCFCFAVPQISSLSGALGAKSAAGLAARLLNNG